MIPSLLFLKNTSRPKIPDHITVTHVHWKMAELHHKRIVQLPFETFLMISLKIKERKVSRSSGHFFPPGKVSQLTD